MTKDHSSVGTTTILKSLGLIEEGKEWRVIYFVVRFCGWFIWFFVTGSIYLSPRLRIDDSWVYKWLLFYLVYLVILEVSRRIRRKFYDTSFFRMIRIQVDIVFTSFLLLETGGAESPLWFIYLSPLFASALYFRHNRTWGIYGEIAILYFIVSSVEIESFSLLHLSSFLTSLSVLLILIVVVHYLVEITKRYGAAEQKANRLQMVQRLNEIGQSLTTLQESPEVLQKTLNRIADAAMQVLEADVIDLYQYRFDKEDFDLPPIMVGERCFPELVPDQILPDDIVFKIAHTGKKIYVSDAQENPTLAATRVEARNKPPKDRFVVREWILSSAAVPMKVNEEVVGVMFVGYRKRHDFKTNPELKEKVETFASFAAIAIQNARLLQQEHTLREQTEGLHEALYAISPALGSAICCQLR